MLNRRIAAWSLGMCFTTSISANAGLLPEHVEKAAQERIATGTGTLLSQAVLSGRVTRDTPVAKLLPSFQNPITRRQGDYTRPSRHASCRFAAGGVGRLQGGEAEGLSCGIPTAAGAASSRLHAALALRRTVCGDWPSVRRKARRMRSRSPKPVSSAMASIE